MSDKPIPIPDLVRLQALSAQGNHGQVVRATEQVVGQQTAQNQPVHFGGTGVVFRYLDSLLRHRGGQLGKFVIIFFEEMPAGNAEATVEVLGDLLRSIALYFVAHNRPPAARGAVSWAIRLHETVSSPAKHFHNKLVMELIYLAQGRPGTAKDKIQAVVEEIEAEPRPFTADLSSIERLSKWWLLLLKCAVGDTKGLADLADWVAVNDASDERRSAAKMLGACTNNAKLARLAAKEIKKELRGR